MIKDEGGAGWSEIDGQNEADRRKYHRVDAPIKARFLNEQGEEHPALAINISASGALLRTKYPPAFGETVVVYFDDLGRFEARVIRTGTNAFAVTYDKKREKRAEIADNLTEIMNTGRRIGDRRKNPRIRTDAPALVYFEDGRSENCAILDISLTGASIEIAPRPPLGTSLILGRMTAKVVRRHDKGVGVVFTGSAKKLEDVIADTALEVAPANPNTGAQFAPKFGKKGASA